MAVREFDGVDDDLQRGTGATSGMGYGTWASMVKFAADGDYFNPHDDADNGLASMFRSGTTLGMYDGAGGLDTTSELAGVAPVSTWLIIVVRKVDGTAAPRFSVYDMDTPGWSHGNGDSNLANQTVPGAGGTWQCGFEGGSLFDGRAAVQALWSDSLPWSADASGDSAIEAAGLETSAANWLDANPSAMWRYNQDSTATAVTDDTGGGADQTSITGTTVVNGDDPPGFSFDLAGTNLAAIAAYYQMLRSA